MTTLGPLFQKPLHVATWDRPLYGEAASHFRVTNTFDGPDLINGGPHHALDVGNKTRLPPAMGGNTGAGEPILCPIDCMVRPIWHWDGALGLDLSVTETLTLRLFHLSKTAVPVARSTGKFLSVGKWEPTPTGRIIGVTGNSGKQPMPAHTHIELWQSGQRIDPAPYLEMVESPALPLPEDDVKLRSGQALTVGDVGKGNRLRTDPNTSAGSVITDATTVVKVLQTDTTGEPYTLSGSTNNRYTTVGLESGEVYYVAAPLVTNIRLKGAGLDIPQITPAQLAAAERKGREDMRVDAINAATGLSV